MTPLPDLVGNVTHFQKRRAALVGGDERPDALNPRDCPLARKLAKRAVRGHPADAEIGDDVVFGRYAVVRRPLAALDAAADELLDRLVARHRPGPEGRQIAFALQCRHKVLHSADERPSDSFR